MAGDGIERRLAAILCADVVGYSRLMEADEAGTLARLKSHREALIDDTISERRGRIVKEMGDGLLVEFPSVVEAVLGKWIHDFDATNRFESDYGTLTVAWTF